MSRNQGLNKNIEKVLVWEDGKEVLADFKSLANRLNVYGIIRIRALEYKNIPQAGYFGHFNLEWTDHQVGKRYSLPRIMRHGSWSATTKEEVLPLLSFENAYKGECLAARQKISYEDVTEDLFEYSMTNIKDIESLKKIILERYSASLPNLTEEEILALGVSFTLLKFIPSDRN